MIYIIRNPATTRQIEEMQQSLETYIKLAVDIQRGILAGGGVMHADCESALLEDGSAQEDIWGADWNPTSQQVTFESLINIRPRQNNPSMEILDPKRRDRVAQIARQLLEQP
jgi:RES domain-containing protein